VFRRIISIHEHTFSLSLEKKKARQENSVYDGTLPVR
jgi:hypothetical protein